MSADVAPQAVQLLVDLSELVRTDARSGIQRATRGVLGALLEAPPPGVRVVPVYDAGGFYAYAPLPGPDGALAPWAAGEETPISVAAGDIFFGLDLAAEQVPRNAAVLRDLKTHGVRLYFVVYDLLPARHPEWFFDGAQAWYTRWLAEAARLADGLICNSHATVNDLLDWCDEHPPERATPLYVGCARLGADLQKAQPVYGLQASDEDVLAAVAARPTLLMVGTLEPRKMHAQALDALELMWRDGADVNLAIVGKVGWNVDDLASRLRTHGELGKRLLWVERASDEMLLKLYERASALLVASAGEGFGLPLIEAAQHGLPVIARDLPVFREVGGAHAWFYEAGTPADLASALFRWFELRARGTVPASSGMPFLSWADSAVEFLRCMDGGWLAQAPVRLSAG
jgi:glycosyltransferase involved in cell wall biosynthesis